MKRGVILVLALLVLLGGCIQQAQVVEEPVAEEPVAEVPVVEEPVAEEPVAEVPVVEEPAAEPEVAEAAPVDGNQYHLKISEPTVIEGKTLILTDMDSSSNRATISVEGFEVKFIGTREEEIEADLLIQVLRFENFGLEDPRTYALVEVKKLVLGEDEYLVMRDHLITLDDVNKTQVAVSYTHVDSGGVRTATVSVGGDSETIVQGRSATFDKFKVTNVKTFTKDRVYAILKIVPR